MGVKGHTACTCMREGETLEIKATVYERVCVCVHYGTPSPPHPHLPPSLSVCGIVVPWNYPLMMVAWKLGACLAAGTVIQSRVHDILNLRQHLMLSSLSVTRQHGGAEASRGDSSDGPQVCRADCTGWLPQGSGQHCAWERFDRVTCSSVDLLRSQLSVSKDLTQPAELPW